MLREKVILIYCNDICAFNDSCKIKHNDCPKCGMWADKILSAVLEELPKEPKVNDHSRVYNNGFRSCLAEIREILMKARTK